MISESLKIAPKIELHLHIDNSISYEGVVRIRPSVTLEEYRSLYVAPMPCANLNEFLACAPHHLALFQCSETIHILVEDVFAQLKRDAVIYAELRFAPLLHLDGGLRAESVVETVVAATRKMTDATGIDARIILCTLRHFTEKQSLATVHLVEDFQCDHVVALDLAGDEAAYPIEPHVAAYRYAHEHAIPTTAHAGEALGPPSVWETLRVLQPQRIGHGVRSGEDDDLLRHLRANETHLEVCPSSNVQIVEGIDSWASHPIDRLYRDGLSVSISTDTRTMTPTTLANEYQHLVQQFRWSERDLLATNLAAIKHAFLDPHRKQELMSTVRLAYQNLTQ